MQHVDWQKWLLAYVMGLHAPMQLLMMKWQLYTSKSCVDGIVLYLFHREDIKCAVFNQNRNAPIPRRKLKWFLQANWKKPVVMKEMSFGQLLFNGQKCINDARIASILQRCFFHWIKIRFIVRFIRFAYYFWNAHEYFR